MSAIGIVMPVNFLNSGRIKDCHCTLIYLGEFGHGNVNRSHVEEACARLRSQCNPAMVNVTGVEVFGQGHATVLTLADRTLKSYRKFIEKELARVGIQSASQYSYNPHITINKHETSSQPILPWDKFIMPSHVWIDRPVVWWGSER